MVHRTAIGVLALLGTTVYVPALADRAGEALLERCEQALKRARSIEADYRVVGDVGESTTVVSGKLVAVKPNLVHEDLWRADGKLKVVINSDGKRLTYYTAASREYSQEALDSAGDLLIRDIAQPIRAFFKPRILEDFRRLADPVAAPAKTIGGVRCRGLRLGGEAAPQTYYTGPDGVIRGITARMGRWTSTSELTNVRLNARVPKAVFAWRPSADSKRASE